MAFFHDENYYDRMGAKNIALGEITPNQVEKRAVRKNLQFKSVVTGTNYTLALPQTDMIPLDSTNLTFTVSTSGERSVNLRFGCTAMAATSGILSAHRFSFLWDGVEVTGVSNGLMYVDSGNLIKGFYYETTLMPESHTEEGTASVASAVRVTAGNHVVQPCWNGFGTGSGTVYNDTNNLVYFRFEED